MAAVMIAAEQVETAPSSEFYTDQRWESILSANRLPSGVARRLKNADKALWVSNIFAAMLVGDARAKADAKEMENTTYAGLPEYQVEALGIAVVLLGQMAAENLEEIREDKYGCIATASPNRPPSR